jgi:hypothetical protein
LNVGRNERGDLLLVFGADLLTLYLPRTLRAA